ncbi:MAG: hypothetical protein RBU30_19690 [Polyangia bacterium]|nr:hypothetical protein [Polyangia bacterium]
MTNHRFERPLLLLTMMSLSFACGPKQDPERPRARDPEAGTPGGDKRPAPRSDDDVQIGGLMGTIDAAAVEKAFEGKMNQVRSCRQSHGGGLGYVSGTVQFFFVIGTDGIPTRVTLEKSELGQHELEACLLGIARGLKFVKPTGGKAEVRYSMDLPAEGDQPKTWEPSKVKRAMSSRAKEIAACRVGGKPDSFTVTFYVLPQGKAQTAGVASAQDLPEGFAACVAKVILGTTFPDPLGEVARVSYEF